MTALVPDANLVAALFERHTAVLRAFLLARCRDADLADDLLQEVALKLMTAAPRLDPARDVRAYLFQAAANVWRDHLRKELVRERARRPLRESSTAVARAADARLLEREVREMVHRAIAALPPAQREVLDLRRSSGLTFREIADRLGRPLGTVLGQMRAALEKIDVALEDY